MSDDELRLELEQLESDIAEAYRALWDGQLGRAFAAIESADERMRTVLEMVSDE